MSAPTLPIASFTVVQAEFARLANEVPHVARRVADELRGWPVTEEDDALSEIEEIEMEIADLEARLERLKAREGFDRSYNLTLKARDAAEAVHALLQQYEGIRSEVLEEVL